MLTPKKIIFAGMIVGSFLGGWVPSLWGAGGFTMSAMVGSAVGGLAGIWIGWKVSQNF
jgi:uncharacterized membrane protein YeaQ/YmgE (transglycosylase-associated protein family)